MKQIWLPGHCCLPASVQPIAVCADLQQLQGHYDRSLPNSSSAPTIMSGLIPIVNSSFGITYRGLLPASNLSCYIASDSNFLVHSLGRVGVRGQAVSVGFKPFVSRALTSSIRHSENKGRGCTGCKAEKLKIISVFCSIMKHSASYFTASFVLR